MPILLTKHPKIKLVLTGGGFKKKYPWVINKNIVSKINTAGDLAIGLSGKDANLIIAKKLVSNVKDPSSNIEKVLDIGFVGEPI